MAQQHTILAIETSCDETAIAVVQSRHKTFKVLANIVSSQVKTHAKYGGIVPEVAARMHVEQIIPLLDKALKQAKITDPRKQIDAVTATTGPGLVTALIVGVETAKSLAYAWDKPFIKTNHIEGHVYSAFDYDNAKQSFHYGYQLPALCLIVSGGHTDLIYMERYGRYERVGGTRDDAVGEAFDKVAKMMGLGYPGGPAISDLAQKATSSRYDLPRPMMRSGDFEMSFSGIKTAVLHRLQKEKKVTAAIKKEMAFEFQEAVTDVLVHKTIEAARKLGVKSIILGGGVAANTELRRKLSFESNAQLEEVRLYTPNLAFTGDNAVMIALAAHMQYQKKSFDKPFGVSADPQWEIG